MARKYDFISELYNRTCKTVVANPASWEAFLRSACYNYRLRFDEQLLVHAQRPDATAVLQIDDWNQKFGRWVNRGAHGIAVFEDADQRRQRLVHYFDISDTHPSRFCLGVGHISLSFRQSLCYDSVHITSIFPQTQRQCYRRTDKPQPLQYHHLLGNFLLVLPKN